MSLIKENINKTKEDISLLEKITTFCICFSPVLFIYRIGIFMVGEVIFIALFALNFFFQKPRETKNEKIRIILFSFALSIIFISSIGYILFEFHLTALPRLIRFFFCLFMGSYLGETSFNYRYAKRCLHFIATLATILIVFQFVYHAMTGGYIYFLARDRIYSNIYNESYFANVETQRIYRPMSIFLEPAHYCQFMLLVLTISLFQREESTSIFRSLFYFVGIIVSTSSTGVIVSILLWIVFFFRLAKDGLFEKKKATKVLLVVFLGTFGFILIFSQLNASIVFSIERILESIGDSNSGAWAGRLGTFSIFTEKDNFWEILFGRGYGIIDEKLWYASIPYFYNGTGLLGLLLLGTVFFSLYKHGGYLERKLLFVFVILCFTSEVLTNYWLILVIPMIINKETNKVI